MSVLSRMDPALVEAARQGDRAALDQLLGRSRQVLQRFARRSCASAEDAEDAVQLALWQLHRKLGTLQTLKAFGSWLFTIVDRECRRLLRLGHRQLPLDEDALAGMPAAAIPLDLRRDLSRCIAALPPIYREVLVLRDIEELTAPEAAAQLGVSVEAVKSRLHRARALLREALAASGYWRGDAPSA